MSKSHDNERRTELAYAALDAFRAKDKRNGFSTSTMEDIIDLITNFGHFTDETNINFRDVIRIALDHWEAERKASG